MKSENIFFNKSAIFKYLLAEVIKYFLFDT